MSFGAYQGQPPPSDRNNFVVPGFFLAAYVAAAKEAELSPVYHLKRAHLPTHGFESEHVVAPHSRFIEMLDASAEAAGQPDFALRVVAHLNLASFGPPGMLASAQPTVREAIIVLARFSGEERRRARATLQVQDGRGVLRFSSKSELPWPSLRTAEVVLGFALRFMQGLLGDDWRPARTTFRAAAPADVSLYEQTFGEVAFDQPFDAVEIAEADLERQLPTANAAVAKLVEQHLHAKTRFTELAFDQAVGELIVSLLPHGLCTIDLVGAHLGVDRRTVHRRLAASGVTFSELVQSVRRDRAPDLLREPDASVTALARQLGFSSVSTFSRWFSDTFGASPARFRKAA